MALERKNSRIQPFFQIRIMIPVIIIYVKKTDRKNHQYKQTFLLHYVSHFETKLANFVISL